MIKLAAKLLLIGFLALVTQIDRLVPEIQTLLASTHDVDRPGGIGEPGPPVATDGERAVGTRTIRRVVRPVVPTRYDPLIQEHSARTGIRPELIRAVVEVESGFDPSARSQAGAMGLMQLMPATAREFDVTDPFDPEDNLRAGTDYLVSLLSRFGGDEELTLAAYNAGPGAVYGYGDRVPPYPETEQYVRRVRAAAIRQSVRGSGLPAGTVEKSYTIDDGWWTVVYTTYQGADEESTAP